MLKSLIHNPRRRGALGALFGALFPYVLWAYENGIALGGDGALILFVCGFSTFFAILGYGFLHGGFRRAKPFPTDRSIGIDLDEMGRASQTGAYAWMREVRERHW
ncbi:hypothetical protein [uncultured Tateyamaria sp.]|uniref:hypothetical protein n=1 Tax=uncultured Tateyamaria sp. TaxID=455651 RepID=UPI00262D3DD0|nr:hypothetical protein [uncultured Tateyamaria sp.]